MTKVEELTLLELQEKLRAKMFSEKIVDVAAAVNLTRHRVRTALRDVQPDRDELLAIWNYFEGKETLKKAS